MYIHFHFHSFSSAIKKNKFNTVNLCVRFNQTKPEASRKLYVNMEKVNKHMKKKLVINVN